jgi:hypothetical protein
MKNPLSPFRNIIADGALVFIGTNITFCLWRYFVTGVWGIPDSADAQWVLYRSIPVLIAYLALYRIFGKIERDGTDRTQRP